MSSVLVLSHIWRNGAESQLFKECVEHRDDETRGRMMSHGDIAMTRRYEG